jgi:hypothetical protein
MAREPSVRVPVFVWKEAIRMAMDFVKTAAVIVIFGFLWRYLAARQAGSKVGAAMSFIY